MKILLLNPPRVRGQAVVREERYEHRDMGSCYPPLHLLQAAGTLEAKGHDVRVIDANGFDLSFQGILDQLGSWSPGLIYGRVAFDCQDEDAEAFKNLGKATGAPVFLRNKILASVPWLKRELIEKSGAAAFVEGEAEVVLPSIADALGSGRALDTVAGLTFLAKDRPVSPSPSHPLPVSDAGLFPTQEAGRAEPFGDLPGPAYHLLPNLKPYHTGTWHQGRFGLLALTRGCPFGCTFCAYRQTGYRQMPAKKAVDEMQRLKETAGMDQFLLFDDIIALKPRYLEEMGELILERGLKVKFVCCTRAELMPRKALAVLKKAGLEQVAVGIESGSREVLDNIEKGNGPDDVRRVAKDCHEEGVRFYGLCIVGLPGETEKSVQDSIDLIRETKPFYSQFGFAIPYPNTPMWNWYEERKFFAHKNLSLFNPLNPEPVIRTEALSREDLIRLRRKIYMETSFSIPNLVRNIRWNDMAWNIQGAREVGRRLLSLVGSKIVR